ncbi:MAG: hypothetical protein R3Y63_03825 [Eubacteriales bacterium]
MKKINATIVEEKVEATNKGMKKYFKVAIFTGIPVILACALIWGVGGMKASDSALGHANLQKNQVSYLRFELDLDDFIPRYEVSWYEGQTKSEYTVHAISGQLLEVDIDYR